MTGSGSEELMNDRRGFGVVFGIGGTAVSRMSSNASRVAGELVGSLE